VGVLIGCFRAVWMANFEKMLFFFATVSGTGRLAYSMGFLGMGVFLQSAVHFFLLVWELHFFWALIGFVFC
jgi:hypothetical protein